MAGRRAPDNARIARMEEAAAEAEDVLRPGDHAAYAQSAGLRNAVAAGLTPPAAFVAGVRAALQAALQKAAQATAGETAVPEGLDAGTTRATRSTLRGVLKRFEDAFGLGTDTARVRRPK